jgi:plasmid stabilization system protein ParE
MKIVWTKRALKQWAETSDYLENEFGIKISNKFGTKLIDKTDSLITQPEQGRKIKKYSNVRRLLIVKRVALHYRIKKQSIEILEIFNQRQNPDKSKY